MTGLSTDDFTVLNNLLTRMARNAFDASPIIIEACLQQPMIRAEPKILENVDVWRAYLRTARDIILMIRPPREVTLSLDELGVAIDGLRDAFLELARYPELRTESATKAHQILLESYERIPKALQALSAALPMRIGFLAEWEQIRDVAYPQRLDALRKRVMGAIQKFEQTES